MKINIDESCEFKPFNITLNVETIKDAIAVWQILDSDITYVMGLSDKNCTDVMKKIKDMTGLSNDQHSDCTDITTRLNKMAWNCIKIDENIK